MPDGAPANANGEGNGSAGEGGADADAPVPYVHFDINHVLSTGQSNSTANGATAILSKTQPYDNVMFDVGVPVPPLVIDTKLVTEAPNLGFELGGDSPPAVTKVEVAGPDTVKITLASAWTGANKRVRYAYTFTGRMNGKTSARGNIRDSEATPSQAGYDLSNWSVHFDLPL